MLLKSLPQRKLLGIKGEKEKRSIPKNPEKLREETQHHGGRKERYEALARKRRGRNDPQYSTEKSQDHAHGTPKNGKLSDEEARREDR